MVFEVAEFRVKDGLQEKFVTGTAASKEIFQRAAGFIGLELHQEIEDPLNFTILVKWRSVEDHVAMQGSDLRPQIREKVADCFAGPPKVRHTEVRVHY